MKVHGLMKRQRQVLRNAGDAMGVVRALGYAEHETAESLVRRGLLTWMRASSEGKGGWYELTSDGWRVVRAMHRDARRRAAQ
jgi:hypothetical protein